MVIVTLTKNSSKTIFDTIQSIQKQSLENIFWLVMDDGSEDQTVDLVRQSKINHEIIKINTKGLFFAYNHALEILKERKIDDIIFFLHSDDLIYTNETLQMVDDIFKRYDIKSLLGNILFFKNDKNKYFRYWKSNFPKKQIKISENIYKLTAFKKKDLLFGWSFPHTSFFFHTSILEKIPKYDEGFKTSSDYGWSTEILLENKFEIYYVDKYITKMKVGGRSTSLFNLGIQFMNDFKIIKKLFYRNFSDIFFCLIVVFSKKIRKIKQFFKIN
jgi:glycosyltransferase